MDVFDLVARIRLEDQLSKGLGAASGKMEEFNNKAKSGFSTVAKVAGIGIAAATTAITALGTSSIKSYAQYEQLVGGVETLFKDAQDKVVGFAQNAYQTAGLSANEYMSTVTSFSASLIQSLGGDTDAAAEVANRAITDMSDNANKMGTDMGAIQSAYQGFAKQNYTMLDNLKLGYGGTKTEMERLISDAAAMKDIQGQLNVTVKEGDLSFSNIANAISVMQTNLGIAGATQQEAMTTIEGSINMTKAAWENFVTGLSDSNADISALSSNLISSASAVVENIIPKISQFLQSASSAIGEAASTIIPLVVSLIVDNLPMLAEAAFTLIEALVTAIIDNAPALIDSAIEIITLLANYLIENLPTIMEAGLQMLVTIIQAIAENLPTLIPVIIDIILLIVDTLTDPDNILMLVDAALELIVALATGLIEALPKLIARIPEIIINIVTALIKAAPKLLAAAVEILQVLWNGIKENFGKVFAKIGEIGKNIIDGIKNGIVNAWNNLVSWFKGLFNDLIGIAKKILGIASPSKVFKKIGGFTMEGLGEGIRKSAKDAQSELRDSMQDLVDEGNSFDLSFGQVQFKSSAVGMSSASMINSSSNGGNPIELVVNLLLPDGSKIASYLLPDLISVANASGTPILNAR